MMVLLEVEHKSLCTVVRANGRTVAVLGSGESWSQEIRLDEVPDEAPARQVSPSGGEGEGDGRGS